MSRTEILTSVFTDIAGYTEKTAGQSRQQQVETIETHDRLLLPVVRHFSGRRIKSVGDGMLLSFRSPTDALRCAMTMQNVLHKFNRNVDEEQRISIRAALNIGEVSVEKHDIFGDSVNLAARVESVTPAGEVYFTQAVYLAMNKAEIPSEAIGSQEFKGIAEKIALYRVIRRETESDELPYAIELPDSLAPEQRNRSAPYAAMSGLSRRFMLLASALVLLLVVAVWFYSSQTGSPEDVAWLKQQAREALDASKLEAAGRLAEDHANKSPQDIEGILLVGHVKMAAGEIDAGIEQYRKAIAMDASVGNDAELVERVVNALGQHESVAGFIVDASSEPILNALEQLTLSQDWARRHSAVHLLRETGYSGRIDEVGVALKDLSQLEGCEDRLEVVRHLRSLGDRRALPALEALQNVSITEKLKNRCLRTELRQTIAELDGQEPDGSDKPKLGQGLKQLVDLLREGGGDVGNEPTSQRR